MGAALGVAAKAQKAKTAAAFIVGSAPVAAAGRITQGAVLSAYEAVRFKKAQPKLTNGSWTSLEKLQVLLPEGADISQAQQAVDRSSAMAKGAIVTRWADVCKRVGTHPCVVHRAQCPKCALGNVMR